MIEKERIFIKRSHIEAPVEEVFKWHERQGALERLTPPWDSLKVIERTGGIKKGARVILMMKAGLIPYRWVAEHTDYEENRFFRDRQVQGPFAKWVHTHRFIPDGLNASFFEDNIEYALPFHPFGNYLAGKMIHNQLETIFNYRHKTTISDIDLHQSRKDKTPMRILISGGSGVIGKALIPFLTTGGHSVVSLVRRKPYINDPVKKEVFWNPALNCIDAENIGKIDAVIHLAGENIGHGKWTMEKKQSIIESRIKGTELIARTASELDPPPKVLICASAIGYYGNRPNQILTEISSPGNDFISKVCQKWEAAAESAVKKGVRVVFARIGVVLTPAGGALARFMTPFKMGLGSSIGSGSQIISWIGIDDAIGALYHMMITETLEGPVNVVSPNPVTNIEFTKTLGKILSRPAMLSIPAFAIKLIFGQMGKEVLLSSTYVMPKKLIDTGYRFRHPNLKKALRFKI